MSTARERSHRQRGEERAMGSSTYTLDMMGDVDEKKRGVLRVDRCWKGEVIEEVLLTKLGMEEGENRGAAAARKLEVITRGMQSGAAMTDLGE